MRLPAHSLVTSWTPHVCSNSFPCHMLLSFVWSRLVFGVCVMVRCCINLKGEAANYPEIASVGSLLLLIFPNYWDCYAMCDNWLTLLVLKMFFYLSTNAFMYIYYAVMRVHVRAHVGVIYTRHRQQFSRHSSYYCTAIMQSSCLPVVHRVVVMQPV